MTPADLIEKLEKATGPDRKLDSAIVDFLVGMPRTAIGGDARYTSSIDAALTLVPEGARVWLELNTADFKPHGAWVGGDYSHRKNYSRTATPAIALCIAALRARASLQSIPKEKP